MKGAHQKTYCQVTFLTPLLAGASEKPLSFASTPSQQDVTKQGMFATHTLRTLIFVMFPTCLSTLLLFLHTKTLENKACFLHLAPKGLDLQCYGALRKGHARACARNTEPSSVSELLSHDRLLVLLISLNGKMKKRLAR